MWESNSPQLLYKNSPITAWVIPIILCRQGFPPCITILFHSWINPRLYEAWLEFLHALVYSVIVLPLSVYVFRHDTYKVLFWNSILKLQQDEATPSKKSLQVFQGYVSILDFGETALHRLSLTPLMKGWSYRYHQSHFPRVFGKSVLEKCKWSDLTRPLWFEHKLAVLETAVLSS